jgi:hypothetical protein
VRVPLRTEDRDRRNAVALELLQHIVDRSHQVLVQVVRKARMKEVTVPLDLVWKDPWEVAFAAMLTMTEEFLRGKGTGPSSTGMMIIDHEKAYLGVVRRQARERQSLASLLAVAGAHWKP